MRFSNVFASVAASASVFSAVNGLNILISNDDGFGTANIRELYKAMKAFGHNVYIVASTSNQSGTGGTAVYTTEHNLTADTEFGISSIPNLYYPVSNFSEVSSRKALPQSAPTHPILTFGITTAL